MGANMMTKYVVTNGKGEYLGRDAWDGWDFGADRKHAKQFEDAERARDMANFGNILNDLGNVPDCITNPYRSEEVTDDEQ